MYQFLLMRTLYKYTKKTFFELFQICKLILNVSRLLN